MKLEKFRVQVRSWITHPGAMLFRAALRANNYPLAKRLTKRQLTFHQKLRHKMLYDRNPLLITFADKIKSKQYVASIIGAEFVVPTLQTAECATEINLGKLPREFAAKVNHASGGMFLVSEDARRGDPPTQTQSSLEIFQLHPADLDINFFTKQLNHWLETRYGHNKGEWAYTQIKPRILVEQLLKFEGNRPPPDYRFFMFHGQLGMLVRDQQTRTGKISNIYSADLVPLEVTHGSLLRPTPERQIPAPELPSVIQNMAELATALSSGVDFLRVDMFEVNDRIYVGELTNYPLAGIGQFSPAGFDVSLGRIWSHAQTLASGKQP